MTNPERATSTRTCRFNQSCFAIVISFVLLNVLSLGGTTAAQGQEHLVTGRTLNLDIWSPNGITQTECVVITKNGEFHIERTVQKLPSRVATKTVEEGAMSLARLDGIKRRLASQEVRMLSEWRQRDIPTANDQLQMVELQIDRDGTVQDTGYVIWHGDSPESQMDTVSTQQANRSKAVLYRIVKDIESLSGKVVSGEGTAKLKCQ